MRASAAAEWLALRKRPATWILVGVWLLLSLIFGYLFPYLQYRSGDSGSFGGGDISKQDLLDGLVPHAFVETVVGGTPMFGGALALVLGALALGSPYGWGTLKTALTQGPRRWQVVGGSLTVLLGLVLGLLVAGFALSAGCSALIAASENQPFDWPGVGDVLRGLGGGWLVLGMWSLAGAALAVLVRGTALAVGLGLVWALVVESLVRGVSRALDWLETIDRVFPGANAGSLVAALGAPTEREPGGTPGVTDLVAGPTASLVVAAYVVLLIGLTVGLTTRRDVT